jgi:hypothetical protein
VRAPEYARSKAERSFRRNGDIGLADLKIEDWRLQLIGVGDVTSSSQYSEDGTNPPTDESDEADTSLSAKKTAMHKDDAKATDVTTKPMGMPENAHGGILGRLLTMADVRKLPHVEMVTEFKSIEGWSEIRLLGWGAPPRLLEAFSPHVETAGQLFPRNL